MWHIAARMRINHPRGSAVKKLAFAIILATAAAVNAMAADLPVKAPAYAPPPVFSWTGFYMGLNGGYGWRDGSQINFTANDPYAVRFLAGNLGIGGTPVVPPANGLGGGFGGFQIGYNWQASRKLLVGIETDFQGSSIDGAGTTASLVSAPTLTATVNADQHVRWFGTLRARLGFLAQDNLLIYGTGGFAYGRIDENINVGVAGTTAGGVITGIGPFNGSCVATGVTTASPNCFIGGSSRTATGWAVGAGGEYAVSRHVTIKAEYLYVNLGGGDGFNVVAQTPPVPSTFRAVWSTADFHTVRAGVNFKF
jgi:outer membrane immunogenic protein